MLPEHIRSAELAADFRVGQGGRLGVSVYRNHIHNMIDQVQDPTDGLYLFTNQSQVQSRGIEFSAERRWVSGHRLRGSVTRQQSRLADGSELGNSPRLVGKLVMSAPLNTGWVLAGQWQGLSSRRSLSSRVPGAGVVNLTVTSPRLGSLGELVLGVYNLRHPDPHGNLDGTLHQRVDHFLPGFRVAKPQAVQVFKQRRNRLVVRWSGHSVNTHGQGL